jgi:hypothetical protein
MENKREVREFLEWFNGFSGPWVRKVTPFAFKRYLASVENRHCMSAFEMETFRTRLMGREDYAYYQNMANFFRK